MKAVVITIAVVIVLFGIFTGVSLSSGGSMAGPTHVDPGNVAVVVDTIQGKVEPKIQQAGTIWQSANEHLYEFPTATRTINLSQDHTDSDGKAAPDPVVVNTQSNTLDVDVTVQYHVDRSKVIDLYNVYQDAIADNLDNFEDVQITPSIKEALNYAFGDEETAVSMTTAGKQQAETQARQKLTEEWQPQGIVFDQIMIRAVHEDQETQNLLASTVQAQQQIQNDQLALQQQRIDNQTVINAAVAEAKINTLKNSTLTDLYVQDQMLNQVKKIYLPSGQIMNALTGK